MAVNPRWDAIFNEREWGIQPATGVILLFALSLYDSDRRNVKVLDLGCGTGANLWYLACEGYQVYGLDGSRKALEECNRLLDSKCPHWKGELRQGDICERLPYKDNFFDVVIDVNSVTCNPFDDMRAVYAEASRVMKPGGYLHAQIFGDGTSPAALAQGTAAEFVEEARLKELFGEFCPPVVNRRSRLSLSHPVNEWLVTCRKPLAAQ